MQQQQKSKRKQGPESDTPHTPLPLNAFCFSSRYGMDLIETELNQLPKRKKAGEQRSRAADALSIAAQSNTVL